MAKPSRLAVKVRRKDKKNVSEGVIFIYSTFNNTLVTVADRQGNTLA